MSEQKALVASTGRAIPAIIPQNSEDFKRIADLLVSCEAVPKSYGTGETAKKKALIAILKGAELGWTPMVAVQSLYVVNNVPTLFGDGVMALVRGSGLLEWCNERIEGEGDDMVATCEVQRKGEPKPVVRTFDKKDAMKAGLLGKQGPWQQYPKRMMQMRARSLALRDVFADILMGLRIKEEVEDYEREETPPPSVDPFADTAQEQPPAEPEAQDAEFEDMAPKPDPAPDHSGLLNAFTAEMPNMNTAKDVDDFLAMWMQTADEQIDDAEAHLDVTKQAKRLAATRKAEIAKAAA